MLAEMVAFVELATADVEMVNVAIFEPPATVTEARGVALELLDERLTTIPPVGAAPLSVTVPVEVEPPVTEVGLTLKLDGEGGVTVSVAVTDFPPAVAVMVAGVEDETGVVAIVKVAVVAPPATVTLAGGAALPLLEASITTVPPGGDVALSVTVPIDELPPTTEEGATERLPAPAAVIVSVAVTDVPDAVAVIVDGVVELTTEVETVKLTELAPPGTVTVPGTVA